MKAFTISSHLTSDHIRPHQRNFLPSSHAISSTVKTHDLPIHQGRRTWPCHCPPFLLHDKRYILQRFSFHILVLPCPFDSKELWPYYNNGTHHRNTITNSSLSNPEYSTTSFIPSSERKNRHITHAGSTSDSLPIKDTR